MTTTNATAKKTGTNFETDVCSRCGGSGRYSYCQTMTGKYGAETCFKCVGAGVVITKRGAAAKAYYLAKRQVSVADLKPGDRIHDRVYGWLTVCEIVPNVLEGMSGTNGVFTPYRREGFDVVTNKVLFVCEPSDKTFTRAVSDEENAAMIADALAYQDTLTKTGAVRKTPARKTNLVALAIADREAAREEALAAI